jgi:hypothetical protein
VSGEEVVINDAENPEIIKKMFDDIVDQVRSP